MLLPGADAGGAVARRRSSCSARLEAPFVLDGQPVEVGASIGIAVAPGTRRRTPTTLLRCADVAMYEAKRGESGVAVYTRRAGPPQRRSPGAASASCASAIDNDELLLHYQPKLDLRDGSLVGVEALVRWQHPQRGFLPPSEFIPLAEQTGLIYPLSRWVLEAALQQHQAWRAMGIDVPVAVNLSRRTLHDPQLAGDGRPAARRAGTSRPARWCWRSPRAA